MPRSAILAALAATLALSPAAAAPRAGSDSHLPLPRYESIATAEAFGRRGPGKDHRIDWVYHARGLPVRVLEEAGPWRRVKDPAGDEVWIHASRLSPNRTVFVKAHDAPRLALRSAPRPEARAVAYLEAGVIATLKECLGGWRRLAVADRADGWAAAEDLWAGEDCALPE
jgi:SH3-like domain-containing protein